MKVFGCIVKLLIAESHITIETIDSGILETLKPTTIM